MQMPNPRKNDMHGMEQWRTKPDAILGNKLEASENIQHARID
jgi:hypothetical protein